MLTKILKEELEKLGLDTATNNGKQTGNLNGNKREEKREETGEYKVGYKKPPKEHQFKPGNPGGPGRTSTLPPMQKLIRMMLEESPIADQQKQELVLTLFRVAARGNVSAIRLIFECTGWAKPAPKRQGPRSRRNGGGKKPTTR